jgi:hypothetical protein
METIKSFTSLEQSRKLAEILPLESADMHYNNISIKGINYADEHRAELMEYNRAIKILSKYTINPLFKIIPCWSLSALINILPEGTRLLKSTNISSVGDIKYHCDCPKGSIDEWFDNPVDACVTMIEKLHELKML